MLRKYFFALGTEAEENMEKGYEIPKDIHF
jgi:hypothetical protein